MNKLLLSLLVSSSVLVACGGGGGGGSASAPAPVTNVSATGLWQGITSPSGYTLDLIVMPDNRLYTVFGTVISGGALAVVGADFGTASVSGSTVTGSFTEYLYNNTKYTGTTSGTVTANTSITGNSLFSNGVSGSYAVSPLSSNVYNFNTPAVLSNIVGSWNGVLLNGISSSLSVSSAGVITGSASSCHFAGVITPDSSGINVYTTSITSGVGCSSPGAVQTGITVSYVTTSGSRQFLLLVSNATSGEVFMAQR